MAFSETCGNSPWIRGKCLLHIFLSIQWISSGLNYRTVYINENIPCLYGPNKFELDLFGLMNAPWTFQRIIDVIIRSMLFVCSYLDDVVVFQKTIDDHRSYLRQISEVIAGADLIIKLLMCSRVHFNSWKRLVPYKTWSCLRFAEVFLSVSFALIHMHLSIFSNLHHSITNDLFVY